ncbi:unnamed protein product [Auanema sp. JU1783]|nr:unnamed protein product [Auanema sp. JU1783]
MYSLSVVGVVFMISTLTHVYTLSSTKHIHRDYLRLLIYYIVSSYASEISLSVVTTPVILLPCLAGYPAGIIRPLHIPTVILATLQSCLILQVFGSFTLLSLYRFYSLMPNMTTTRKTFYKKLTLTLYMISIIPMIVVVIFFRDRKEDKKYCADIYVGFKNDIFEEETVAFQLSKDNPRLIMCIAIVIISIFGYSSISVSCTVSTYRFIRYRSSATHKYSQSLKQQKELGFALMCLSLILVILHALLVLIMLSIIFVQTFNQTFVNCCLVLLVVAQALGPVVIMGSMRSYRIAVYNFFLSHKRSVSTKTHKLTEITGKTFVSKFIMSKL